MTRSVADELSPRAYEILMAARHLLEARGAAALSMRNLAQMLGMRASSLYKHFGSKEAIEAMLISVGFEEQAAIFAAALEGVDEPLKAMARSYRAYALQHPELYRLMYDRPLNRGLLVPGVEDAAAAPAIVAAGGNADLARAAWAFAHGMAMLELNARFTPGADLDAAWDRGIASLAEPDTAPQ